MPNNASMNGRIPELGDKDLFRRRNAQPASFLLQDFADGAPLNAKLSGNVLLLHTRVVLRVHADAVAINVIESLLPVPALHEDGKLADRRLSGEQMRI